MLENTAVKVDYTVYRETYSGWKIPTRDIKNHELVFIFEGECNITIEGKKHKCKKNDLIYFYPEMRHSLNVTKAPYAIFYAVHFDFDKKNKLPIPDISNIRNNYKLKEYFKELLETSKNKEYMYKWKLGILMQNILFEVLSHSNSGISPTNLTRINKVIEHIHKNPYKKFSIDNLCKMTGQKKSYFIKNFKSITGKPPIKYIIDLKLEHARDLILTTDLPIKKIALECGFEDEFYFSRIFKKRYGLPPRSFIGTIPQH